MHIADTLSRAHLSDTVENDSEEIELAVHTLTKHIPVSEARRAEFTTAVELDCSLQQVKKLTVEGWPDNINNTPESVKEY